MQRPEFQHLMKRILVKVAKGEVQSDDEVAYFADASVMR